MSADGSALRAPSIALCVPVQLFRVFSFQAGDAEHTHPRTAEQDAARLYRMGASSLLRGLIVLVSAEYQQGLRV